MKRSLRKKILPQHQLGVTFNAITGRNESYNTESDIDAGGFQPAFPLGQPTTGNPYEGQPVSPGYVSNPNLLYGDFPASGVAGMTYSQTGQYEPSPSRDLPSGNNTPYVMPNEAVEKKRVYDSQTGEYNYRSLMPSAGNTPYVMPENATRREAEGMGNASVNNNMQVGMPPLSVEESTSQPQIDNFTRTEPTMAQMNARDFQTTEFDPNSQALSERDSKKVMANANSPEFNQQDPFQFFNPYGGVDIPTAAFTLGTSIQEGNTLGTVGSAVKLAAGLGRNITSGLGQAKRQETVMDDYKRKQRDYITGANRPQYYQDGGYVYEFDKGATDITDEQAQELAAQTGFTPEFAREYFRQPPVNSNEALSQASQKRRRFNPETDRVSDITSGRNKYTGDGVIVGDYKKIWLNQKPEHFVGKNQPKEGVDFNYMNAAEFKKFQATDNYKNYKAGYPTQTVTQAFQKGGKLDLAGALTGEYVTGMDKANPMMAPNAEVEKGEYLQDPAGEIQQVVGKTHEKGGEEVNLEDQTRILSDHLKIGGDNAKHFKNNFDIDVKASDTYATVLDKYNKKSGLKKIVDEQENTIKGIEKQQLETENDAALGLNMQHLSGKMKELEEDKKPLEEARKILFDELFTLQEKSKPKETSDKYQEGGLINNLAAKYGIAPDKAQELLKQFQAGGISQYYSPLDVNTGNFGRQNFTRDTTLSVEEQEALRRARMQQETLPYLMNRTGLIQGDNITNDPNAINRFQVGYNEYLTNAVKAIESNPNISEQNKQALIQRLGTENFGEGMARDFDSIYGDFTSSRSGVYLPALTKEDREKYGDAIKRVGDVVNPDGTIKEEFKDLSPGAKDYIQNVASQGAPASDIGLLDIETPVQAPVTNSVVETPVNPGDTTAPADATDVQKEVDRRMGAFLMPDQNPLPPTGLQAHLKVNRRFDRVQPALISPEQNLEEIRRQETTATSQINMMPDSQRMAALATMNANTQQNINKAVSETAKINAQLQSQANSQNARIQMAEENAGAQDALSYEQRQLRALALTQNDYANYYNTVQGNNVKNFNVINDLNLMNAMYDDYQFTDQGIEKTSKDINWRFNNGVPKKELPKKKTTKKKLGGRFKNN